MFFPDVLSRIAYEILPKIPSETSQVCSLENSSGIFSETTPEFLEISPYISLVITPGVFFSWKSFQNCAGSFSKKKMFGNSYEISQSFPSGISTSIIPGIPLDILDIYLEIASGPWDQKSSHKIPRNSSRSLHRCLLEFFQGFLLKILNGVL